ncbi:hypothetical protein [Shimazuella kribbensis]|uniref:hypothetical protein n=1 Tax=Shimazuella kribbensis TaxID=139808 RepID=UPI00042847BF|nr:hypothetical protein [Shimazuella kribbensis]
MVFKKIQAALTNAATDAYLRQHRETTEDEFLRPAGDQGAKILDDIRNGKDPDDDSQKGK